MNTTQNINFLGSNDVLQQIKGFGDILVKKNLKQGIFLICELTEYLKKYQKPILKILNERFAGTIKLRS